MTKKLINIDLSMKRVSAVLMLAIIVSGVVLQSVSALSAAQKALFQENINYFDVDTCSTNAPTPPGVANNKIYVIGDSLTVGMRDKGNLKAKLTNGGWSVNKDNGIEATTSINIPDSIPKLKADTGHAVSDAGTVVVGLGTNPVGGGSANDVESMISAINDTSPDAQIVWINAYGTQQDYSGFNTVLNNHVGTGKGKITKVLDWAQEAKANAGTYDLASGGGIHTSPSGYIKRSEWVVQSLGAVPGATTAQSSNSLTCCPSASAQSTQLIGNGPGEQVFNYFIQQGLSNDSAAASTGNLQLESANWGYINKWGGGGGNYYGLAQWSRNDRYPKLVNFSGGNANPSLAQQLAFVWHELTTVSSYKPTLDILRSNASLRDKTLSWARVYEGAVNADGSLQMPEQRVAYATAWANKPGGGAGAGTASTVDPSGATGDGCSGSTGGSTVGYTNPFPGGWKPGRLDMGYDGTFTGQIVAPFSGTITYATKSFSNWGGYIEIKADKQPSGLPTSTLYFAEGVAPAAGIANNKHVDVGTPIADAFTTGAQAGVPGNIEFGVAQDGPVGSPSDTYTKVPGNGSAKAVQSVLDFAKWVEQVLNVAPPSSTGNAGSP